VVVLADGQRVVTAGRDETIVVRDLDSDRVTARYLAPEFAARPEPRDLKFGDLPDYRFCGRMAHSIAGKAKRQRVVTAAGFGPNAVRVRVLTFEDAKSDHPTSAHPVAEIQFRPEIQPPVVIIDPNDKFVFGRDPDERLRQADAQVNGYRIYDVALSPDGRWLTVAHSLNQVDLFDLDGNLSEGKPVRRFGGKENASAAGHRPLFFSGGELLLGGLRHKAPRWDAAGRIDALVDSRGLSRVLFDSDEKWFVQTRGEQLEHVSYDAATRRLNEQPLSGHAAAIRSLAMSPNEKQFASSDANGTVIVWDVATLEDARRFQLGPVDVPQIAFVDGGKQLLTADSAGRLLLWDVPPPPKGNPKPRAKKKPSSKL
jgi:WD40 repeat protein